MRTRRGMRAIKTGQVRVNLAVTQYDDFVQDAPQLLAQAHPRVGETLKTGRRKLARVSVRGSLEMRRDGAEVP